MVARRSVPSGILAAAALLPAVLWLLPALVQRQAPSFRDAGDFFFPVKLHTADRLRALQLPLWNPLSGMGEPWLANGQSGVFYPPTLFFLLPSPGLAAALYLLFHFTVAVWGARRFLKEEAVSEAGALFGAATLAGCGFAASLALYWNHFGAWAYLPGIVSLARSGLTTRGSRLALAALVGLQAMAGSPEFSAATLAVGLLFAWRARPASPDGWQAPAGRRLRRYAGAAALGMALAGWVLLPAAELALHSDRASALAPAERDRGSAGAPALSSALGISPDPSATSYLPSLYLGPLALLAACAAFAEKERRRLVALLAAVAGAGVLFALAAPPGPWIRSLPGLDRLRYPAKGLGLTFFAIAMMAGVGADSLRFALLPRRRLLAAGLAAGALALLLLSRQPLAVRATAAAGAAALLLLAVGGPEVLPRTRAALQAAAALALCVSLFWAGRGLYRFAPDAEIRRPPEALATLSRLPGRVLTPPMEAISRWTLEEPGFAAATLRRQRESLLGYTNLLSGVATVRTAAPLATLAARHVADSIDRAPDPSRAAGAASARALWTPFQPPGLGSAKKGPFFLAPINPYRSRLSFVTRYRIEADASRAWDRVARGEVDWSREVLLDREPAPAPPAGARPSYVVGRIAEDSPELVIAEVNSDAAGILVLTDLSYPGWSARADDRPVPLLRADGFFRAVALPAGAHRVAFRYRPASFYAGAAVSLLALVAGLALLRRGEPAGAP